MENIKEDFELWNMQFKDAAASCKAGAVLRKKYLGGLAPHHLGGNNKQQNYCVQLSSIKHLMYRNYPENLGGWARFWGACAPLAPT